jgi:hypothetical protein
MLILRRKEGQWIEITHRSGDTIRVRVCNMRGRSGPQVNLAFEDDSHNFTIERPERTARATTEPIATIESESHVAAG